MILFTQLKVRQVNGQGQNLSIHSYKVRLPYI
jgi:hypothetical protein